MNRRAMQVISCLIIAAAIGLIGLGISNGGYRDVWNKARIICFECIGIG